VKERPIIFNSQMVRSLLDGRKTQTRRIVKPQPPDGWNWCGWQIEGSNRKLDGSANWSKEATGSPVTTGRHSVKCPYGQTGDRLWVRETWSSDDGKTAYYRADGETHNAGLPWRPSIHMPRWASRITLEITGVRIERLQDITEEAAWSEGCIPGDPTDNGGYFPAEEPDPKGNGSLGWDCARDWFADLWDSIYGGDPAKRWDANPWVWVAGFDVVTPRMGKDAD